MKGNSATQGSGKVGPMLLTLVLLAVVIATEEYRIHKLNQPTLPSTIPSTLPQKEGVSSPWIDNYLYRIYGRDMKDMFDSLSLHALKFGYAIGISGGNLVIEDGKVVENPIPMCPELKEAQIQHTQFDFMGKFNKLKVYTSEEYQIIRKQRAAE
jgi:hypothetical protein